MTGSDPGDEAAVPSGCPRRVGRRRRWRRLSGLVAAGLALYLATTAVQVVLAAGEDQTVDADAVVVLGAAQYNGVPSPVLRARLDHALDLWNERRAVDIVVTGSRQPGDRFTEARAGFEYLRDRGVPEASLLLVDTGTSTWESLAAASRVLRERAVTRVDVVTDPYHALRVRGIADEVGLDAHVSPTDADYGFGSVVRETALVSVGRVLGYRRVVNWFE